MGNYCLALAKAGDERDKLIAFLVSALGLEQKEAGLRLKSSPGFLAEGLDFEPAMAARAKAEAAGLKTMVVENRSLPELPRPFEAVKIEFKSDGFYYQNKTQKDFAPYESLTMLAAAAVETFLPPKTAQELEAGLLGEIRRKILPEIYKPSGTEAVPQKELGFYADIFFARPHGPGAARLRLRHDEFDFSGLGASKTYSSLENFRLMLGELEDRSFSKPLMNRAFAAIRNRTRLTDFILPSAEAYEKELTWLCLRNFPV